MIEQKIKILEMMGYEIVDNRRFAYIQVAFRMKDDYVICLSVPYQELVYDDIIEKIVRKMNEAIKN